MKAALVVAASTGVTQTMGAVHWRHARWHRVGLDTRAVQSNETGARGGVTHGGGHDVPFADLGQDLIVLHSRVGVALSKGKACRSPLGDHSPGQGASTSQSLRPREMLVVSLSLNGADHKIKLSPRTLPCLALSLFYLW